MSTNNFFKTQYLSPEVVEYDVLTEGVLCMSDENEDYAGVPGEDETIF